MLHCARRPDEIEGLKIVGDLAHIDRTKRSPLPEPVVVAESGGIEISQLVGVFPGVTPLLGTSGARGQVRRHDAGRSARGVRRDGFVPDAEAEAAPPRTQHSVIFEDLQDVHPLPGLAVVEWAYPESFAPCLVFTRADLIEGARLRDRVAKGRRATVRNPSRRTNRARRDATGQGEQRHVDTLSARAPRSRGLRNVRRAYPHLGRSLRIDR